MLARSSPQQQVLWEDNWEYALQHRTPVHALRPAASARLCHLALQQGPREQPADCPSAEALRGQHCLPVVQAHLPSAACKSLHNRHAAQPLRHGDADDRCSSASQLAAPALHGCTAGQWSSRSSSETPRCPARGRRQLPACSARRTPHRSWEQRRSEGARS